MIVCFELTMPHTNSWNGRWSGEERKHYLFRTMKPTTAEKVVAAGSYYYNFGDGWAAEVRAEIVSSAEKRKRQKVNAGFCGYDWMVDSILNYGKILNSIQEKAEIERRREQPAVPV